MASIQATKDYAGDWAKEKSRVLVRDMIKNTLLRFKRPELIKVLCLPGVCASGIFEIYDPLGIPRANIVGVERDTEVAEILRRKNLGIRVEKADIERYAAMQHAVSFDIISLDYTNPITWAEIGTLRRLCAKQTLDHFVLHQANLVKRDKKAYPMYAIGAGFSSYSEDDGGNTDLAFLQHHARVNAHFVRSANLLECDDNKREVKSSSYSALLRSSFQGASTGGVEDLLKFTSVEEYAEILRVMGEYIEKFVGEKVVLDREQPLGKLSARFGVRPDICRFFEESIFFILSIEARRIPIDFKPLNHALMLALSDVSKGTKFFRMRDAKSYSYISESGAPMIGDIYFVSHPRKLNEVEREVTHLIGWPGAFRCAHPARLYDTVMRLRSENRRFMDNRELAELSAKIQTREYLGSSAKPVLTKQRAIEEFQQGKSVDEVKARYRGWSEKPLAQWKAHVTMGTYSQPIRTDEEVVEHQEDSNLEKISKEDAVELISSGIPVEEIHDAYPTSFTLGQLRAYKAHVTMGTYRDNSAPSPEK